MFGVTFEYWRAACAWSINRVILFDSWIFKWKRVQEGCSQSSVWITETYSKSLCFYVQVFAYLNMYENIRVYTRALIFVWACVQICSCMYTWLWNLCKYVFLCVCVYTYACMHTCKYAFMYTGSYTCMQITFDGFISITMQAEYVLSLLTESMYANLFRVSWSLIQDCDYIACLEWALELNEMLCIACIFWIWRWNCNRKSVLIILSRNIFFIENKLRLEVFI
jgi:hypothetical protein